MADGVAVGSGSIANTISSDGIKVNHAQDTLGPATFHFSAYKDHNAMESHRSTSKFPPLIAGKQFELKELGAIFINSKDANQFDEEEMILTSMMGSPPEIHAS